MNDTCIACLQTSELPWEPLGPRSHFKLLRTHEADGWTSLVRLSKDAGVPRHRHQGLVMGYVLEGSGRYADTDLMLRPGTFVVEPDGVVDEIINTGDRDLLILFHVHGPILFGADGEAGHLSTAGDKVRNWPHAYIDQDRLTSGGSHGRH